MHEELNKNGLREKACRIKRMQKIVLRNTRQIENRTTYTGKKHCKKGKGKKMESTKQAATRAEILNNYGKQDDRTVSD